MLNAFTDILRCPVCKNGVSVEGGTLCCLGGKHRFDVAREGYVNLATGHAPGGDSKEAIAARTSFLQKGYYAPAATALEQAVRDYLPRGATLIDAGCGQGYYDGRLAVKGFRTLGVDLSKFGCARAAKDANAMGLDNAAYVVASVYTLPIKDACADGVVNVFAPCAEQEYGRVLKDGGHLFLLGAGPQHLMGLKRAMYEITYENAERADLPAEMTLIETRQVRSLITVEGQGDIAALFSMTPYYWRTSEQDKQKLLQLDTLTTEVDMLLYIYRK